MSTIPYDSREQVLVWCQAHVEAFAAHQAVIGLSPQAVERFTALTALLAEHEREAAEARARAEAATLRVNAWPWAQVSVDEGPPRPTPHDFSLSPGTHAVRVQYNTGGEESLRVDLRSGEVRTLPFRRGW